MSRSLRFLLRKCVTDPETQCVVWMGARRGRYGVARRNGRPVSVHRLAYRELVGPIPAKCSIHHLCRNKLCVNEDHMVLVTDSEHAKIHIHEPGATWHNCRKTHCKRGHAYDEANTYWRPDGKGRDCRTCHGMRQRELVHG